MKFINHQSYTNQSFENLEFANTELKNITFRNCKLSRITFTNCTISSIKLYDSTLQSIVFDNCKLDNYHISNSTVNIKIMGCICNNLWITESKLWGVSAEYSQFSNPFFQKIDNFMYFENCCFYKPNFYESRITASFCFCYFMDKFECNDSKIEKLRFEFCFTGDNFFRELKDITGFNAFMRLHKFDKFDYSNEKHTSYLRVIREHSKQFGVSEGKFLYYLTEIE